MWVWSEWLQCECDCDQSAVHCSMTVITVKYTAVHCSVSFIRVQCTTLWVWSECSAVQCDCDQSEPVQHVLGPTPAELTTRDNVWWTLVGTWVVHILWWTCCGEKVRIFLLLNSWVSILWWNLVMNILWWTLMGNIFGKLVAVTIQGEPVGWKGKIVSVNVVLWTTISKHLW